MRPRFAREEPKAPGELQVTGSTFGRREPVLHPPARPTPPEEVAAAEVSLPQVSLAEIELAAADDVPVLQPDVELPLGASQAAIDLATGNALVPTEGTAPEESGLFSLSGSKPDSNPSMVIEHPIPEPEEAPPEVEGEWAPQPENPVLAAGAEADERLRAIEPEAVDVGADAESASLVAEASAIWEAAAEVAAEAAAEPLAPPQPRVLPVAEPPAESSVAGNQDLDVLKNYIAMKESEARDLKEQQRQSIAMIKRLSRQLESMVRKSRDTLTLLENERQRNESLKKELHDQRERHLQEVGSIKAEYDGKLRKAGNVEVEAKELEVNRQEWKNKIHEELKKIKLKERELENKYELLKRDTQALLDSKDKHVLELKTKSDALELNLESLETRLRDTHTALAAVDGKKKRLVETLRLAISLLEQIDRNDDAKG